MEKVLHLNRISTDNTVTSIGEICAFTYSAKRMGSAPTISATFYSFEQNAVDSNCFVTFRGERYFISKTPTSSKSNTDARYKYDLEFLSERHTLENIYFYDVAFTNETSVAQQTTFKFGGTVRDLADKIQLSIDFSYGNDSNGESYYKVIVDEGIDDDNVWKSLEFQDKSILDAIQEFYNTFELPYYYVCNRNDDGTPSREFHVGYDNKSVISDEVFKYGADNSLLSITRSNANFKAINKITGVGSSENLPYYYPNASSTGEHSFSVDGDLGVVNINYDVLNRSINLHDGASLLYKIHQDYPVTFLLGYTTYTPPTGVTIKVGGTYQVLGKKANSVTATMLGSVKGTEGTFAKVSSEFNIEANVVKDVKYVFKILAAAQTTPDYFYGGVEESKTQTMLRKVSERRLGKELPIDMFTFSGSTLTFTPDKDYKEIFFTFDIVYYVKDTNVPERIPTNVSFSVEDVSPRINEDYFIINDSEEYITLSKSGIRVSKISDGSKITISPTLNWIQQQTVLMPPIYRETFGKERFYIAKNDSDVVVSGFANDKYNDEPYPYEYSYNYGEYDEDGELSKRHEFSNPFLLGQQVEHILKVDDIKPTIKGATYKVGSTEYPLDVFADFAYDDNDNDELTDNNEYKHPYFYAKLNPLGFNLFAHQSEQGEMTISMTSGRCIGCNFVIGVDKDSKKNLVQVDGNGNLLRDSEGNVRSGRAGMPKETPQSIQNDTTDHHVWIALKKDEESYGVLYPNATNAVRPDSNSDTFVIVNINLPQIYITAAEKRLEDAIKKYLIENNDEKFKYSIKFSRIYLQEHESVRNQLTENSRLFVQYFGEQQVGLYVSSFTYKVTENEALPEISVELVDTLSIQTSVLKNVANQVKMEVMTSVASVDVVAQGARAFLRKDQDDQTVHKITANEITVNGDGRFFGDANVDGQLNTEGGLAVKRRAQFGDTIESNGDITVGEYTEILGEIQGAKIAQDGSGVFKSIRANQLEISTLIYNQIRSSSAYTSFDDSGTIIAVDEIDGNKYKITFDSTEDSYSHPFKNGDILWGYVNKLNDFEYSKAGRCWMWVSAAELEDEPWSLEATLFNGDDCPDGENIIPTDNMVVMHRGSVDSSNKERQRTFYISAKDGSIVQLLDVTSPKLYSLYDGDNSNYGVVIGRLPDDLLHYINKDYSFVSKEDPVLYAKYLAVQNLLQIDYAGRPVKTERYRGDWNPAVANSDDPYRSKAAFGSTYYDTVTYNGSLWECLVDKTKEQPTDDFAEWHKKVSKGDDSTAVVYQLKPSANVVYYRTAKNKLSVKNLEVVVGVTDNDGYYEIADQYTLEQRGLAVYYAVDGEGEPTLLNISPDGQFVLEDGSGLIIAETGNELLLEGDSLDISAIKDNITLYLKDIDTNDDRATYIIPVIKDGEEGKQGRMLYPAGEWDATKKYAIENNSAPFVRYQKDENSKPTYYVLVWEGGAISGIDPATDVANNGGYWKAFSYMNYLFAEFLMANWAQFGGDNGAVFYDKYLFSQWGVDKDGKRKHYSEFKGNMWNSDGTLSDEFTPSLFIDMYTGSLKANKLAETFAEYEYNYLQEGENSSVDLYANEIDFDKTYNIKYNGNGVRLLTMPLAEDIKTTPSFKAQGDTAIDGLKSIIINRANMNWERRYRATINGSSGTTTGYYPFDDMVDAISGNCLLLCATPILFHPYAWKIQNDGQGNYYNVYNPALTSSNGDIGFGFFVVNGILTNFLLIETGMKAVLRSCRATDGTLYWYVENGDDFVSIPYTIYLKLFKAYNNESGSLTNIPIGIDMWRNIGDEWSGSTDLRRRCFVSKSLYEIYKKLVKNEQRAFNIDIKMIDDDDFYDMNMVEDWSWEKCVLSVSVNREHNEQ